MRHKNKALLKLGSVTLHLALLTLFITLFLSERLLLAKNDKEGGGLWSKREGDKSNLPVCLIGSSH